eukprot:1111452-Lingulodinium_polyedra.AAC.1
MAQPGGRDEDGNSALRTSIGSDPRRRLHDVGVRQHAAGPEGRRGRGPMCLLRQDHRFPAEQ